VADQETVGGLIVDERVVGQPLDRSAGAPGIEEGVPRREQAGMLLAELIFEPAEGSLALDGPGQPAPGPLIAVRWRAPDRAVGLVVVASCEDDDLCFRDDVDEAVLVVDPS